MTLDEIYTIDPSVERFVQWVKNRYKDHRNPWSVMRSFLASHVGWERNAKPTEATLPLFSSEAYDTVLREIYPYID